jgi:hypothetical protein
VHGSIRQQADAMDAHVGEDLAAQPDSAQVAPGAGLRAFARAVPGAGSTCQHRSPAHLLEAAKA